ncbi:MAG: hypothetical protein ACOYNN_07055 [Terrimicrobiaceae bacterium]|jgi:hypothetical protein
MRRALTLIFAVSLLSGCSIFSEVRDERYQRNNAAGDRWLSDQFDASEINVSGSWLSSDWGRGAFRQNGRKVSGTLGGYNVNGVVSGRRAYLLIADGEWYYYSAVLEMSQPGQLDGRFSRMIPFLKTLSRPMRLDQLAH